MPEQMAPGRAEPAGGQLGGTGGRVCWSDEVDEVVRGDLTAAAAYLTPAGGRW